MSQPSLPSRVPSPTIGIIDYGMGNLRSVQKAFELVGARAEILPHPDAIAGIDRLILPGIGAFGDGMINLRRGGWIAPIKTFIERGRPFLGICLGMQLLFDSSTEDATSPDQPVPGLGVLPGRVVQFDVNRPDGSTIKVPHMGWNTLRWSGDDPLLEGLPQDAAVYFVHSYYCVPTEPVMGEGRVTSATAEYPTGVPFTSTLCTGNLWATQFHPEKSQRIGLRMLRNFATLEVLRQGPRMIFPLLAEPASYQACDLDLSKHADRRAYWVNLYRTHFPGLLEEAVEVEIHDGKPREDAVGRATAAKAEFFAYLESLATSVLPNRLDILTIGLRREGILREHGFADPYRLVKERENAAALLALPKLLAELDAMPASTPEQSAQREMVLIQGTFAGNIFDVGAAETLALFKAGKIDFHQTRAKLKPRPWRIDHFDAWLTRLRTGPAHRAAVLFVDNCGCDIVLGMIPFARALLQRGTQVILAANTSPSLNDITAPELRAMIAQIVTWDRTIACAYAAHHLEVIASGCGTPLIDLSRVAPELAEAVIRRGVDLVVLEGMGRAVESNLHAKFTCDVMNLALVKDPDVARHIGGEMYDQVMRFEEGASTP